MKTAVGDDLPTLDVDSVSPKSITTAQTLLEGYYYQDQRESCLLRGDPEKAEDAARKAIDRMGTTYEVEFSHLPADRSREAGEAFMKALFLQDEIENWALLQDIRRQEQLTDVLLSEESVSDGANAANDPRWETVRTYLYEVCDKAGIDDRYAVTQSQFWLLHGQLNEYWEEVALEAHELKLQAIVDDPPPEAVARLGNYFVTGVKLHDNWSHRDKSKDLEGIVDLVSRYYQKIFQLRGDGG